MARLTPEQLQEAKRQKQEQRRIEEEEQAAAVEQQNAQLRSLEQTKRDLNRLEGVVDNLYNEMDKLSKKAPADQITELAMGRVNDVISRGKRLMEGDEYIDPIELFVPAGDRPEHRDIVLVLSELREGIKRAIREHDAQRGQLHKSDGFGNGTRARY